MPKNVKDSNLRLRNSFVESQIEKCQFPKKELYEFEEESFCLLHLPYTCKKEQKLNAKANAVFNEYVKSDWTNFNFVCLESLKLEPIENKAYSFIGAWLWSFSMESGTVQALNFSYCKIQGTNKIANASIETLLLKNSDIYDEIHLIGNHITNLLIFDNALYGPNGELGFDHRYGLTIDGGEYSLIRFSGNKFYTPLRIRNLLKTDELDFTDTQANSHFYVVPDFHKKSFIEIPKLVLPKCQPDDIYEGVHGNNKKKKEWTTWLNRTRDLNTLKYVNTLWIIQYTNLREIYNITKAREFYIEQGSYFSLMQYCLRQNTEKPQWLRQISYLYHKISDYGQNIFKPIWLLIGVTIANLFFWLVLGFDFNQASSLTLTSLKPFSLIYDENPRRLLSSLCGIKKPENLSYEGYTIVNLPSRIEPLLKHSDTLIPMNFSMETEEIACNSIIEYEHGWLLAIWSILVSLFNITLYTCIGLALRWNFRRG